MSASPSSVLPSGTSPQALREAAEWFALLRSGEAKESDRSDWQSWLDRAESHRLAWQYVEAISRRFMPIQSSTRPQMAVNAFRAARSGARSTRRRAMLGLAALAGTGLLGMVVWQQTPLHGVNMAWMADHRTATGQTHEVVLSDGTRVWLDTASAFNEDYREDLRRLQLVAGAIFVETGHDASRPFVIDTPQGRLRALGTRFSVRLGTGATRVSVFEGAVEVRAMSGDHSLILQAGEQTRFTTRETDAVEPADPAGESWRHGILIAQNVPLDDFIGNLGRYCHGYLSVAPEIAKLPVFGSYPAMDPERALAMLASVMPVRIHRMLPWWTVIEAKNDG